MFGLFGGSIANLVDTEILLQKFIIRRLILLIPIVFGITSITFIMIHAIPGDPLAFMYSGNSRSLSPVDRVKKMESLGLNDPLPVQYMHYISRLFQGDMGESIITRQPVSFEIAERIPDTLMLVACSMLIAILLAIPIGIISALKRGTWLDMAAMTGALFGVSLPSFWFGIMLMLLFCLYLGWLPSGGQGKTPVEYLKSAILPSLTLSLIMLGLLTRMVRSSMLEVMDKEYIRTAYAKGIRKEIVIIKHALPNAFIPVLTVVTGMVANLLGGAVIIEEIFSWPGIGRLVVNAITRRDYQVVSGAVLVYSVIVIIINLLTDIAYSIIDPRIRLQ